MAGYGRKDFAADAHDAGAVQGLGQLMPKQGPDVPGALGWYGKLSTFGAVIFESKSTTLQLGCQMQVENLLCEAACLCVS